MHISEQHVLRLPLAYDIVIRYVTVIVDVISFKTFYLVLSFQSLEAVQPALKL